jgi:hypothetical protein
VRLRDDALYANIRTSWEVCESRSHRHFTPWDSYFILRRIQFLYLALFAPIHSFLQVNSTANKLQFTFTINFSCFFPASLFHSQHNTKQKTQTRSFSSRPFPSSSIDAHLFQSAHHINPHAHTITMEHPTHHTSHPAHATSPPSPSLKRQLSSTPSSTVFSKMSATSGWELNDPSPLPDTEVWSWVCCRVCSLSLPPPFLSPLN